MADAAEVTVTVAVPLAPDASVSEAGESVPVQPAGAVSVSVKEDAVQTALSLLVTEAVNATGVPAATPAPCSGERLTTGFARTQGLETMYVADAVAVKLVAPAFFAVAVIP